MECNEGTLDQIEITICRIIVMLTNVVASWHKICRHMGLQKSDVGCVNEINVIGIIGYSTVAIVTIGLIILWTGFLRREWPAW